MKKNRFKKNYRIATAAYAFVLVVALIVSSASGLPENSSLSAVMTGNIAAPQVSAAQAILKSFIRKKQQSESISCKHHQNTHLYYGP